MATDLPTSLRLCLYLYQHCLLSFLWLHSLRDPSTRLPACFGCSAVFFGLLWSWLWPLFATLILHLKKNQSRFGCWWQSCLDILIYIYISRLVPLLLLACCGLLLQRSVVLIHLSPQLSPFWSRCCLARCLLVTPDKHSMFKQWLFGLFGLFGVYGVILVNIFLPSGHIPRNVIYSQKKVHQVGCSNLQHDSFPNTWTSRAKNYWKKRLKHTSNGIQDKC